MIFLRTLLYQSSLQLSHITQSSFSTDWYMINERATWRDDPKNDSLLRVS
jgi:hypothetical protein